MVKIETTNNNIKRETLIVGCFYMSKLDIFHSIINAPHAKAGIIVVDKVKKLINSYCQSFPRV